MGGVAAVGTGEGKIAAIWPGLGTSRLAYQHGSHRRCAAVFPQLHRKAGMRKIGENPGKPWEVHWCTMMLWGSRGKMLPHSIRFRANNLCILGRHPCWNCFYLTPPTGPEYYLYCCPVLSWATPADIYPRLFWAQHMEVSILCIYFLYWTGGGLVRGPDGILE